MNFKLQFIWFRCNIYKKKKRIVYKHLMKNIDPFFIYKYFQCVNFLMKSFNYSQDDTLRKTNGIGRGLNVNVVQILKWELISYIRLEIFLFFFFN